MNQVNGSTQQQTTSKLPSVAMMILATVFVVSLVLSMLILINSIQNSDYQNVTKPLSVAAVTESRHLVNPFGSPA